MKNLMFILAISFATLVSCTKEKITPNLDKTPQPGTFVELVLSDNVLVADTLSVAISSPVNDTLKVYTSVGSKSIKIDFGSYTTFNNCTVKIVSATPTSSNNVKYSKTITNNLGITASVSYELWISGDYLVQVVDNSSGSILTSNLIHRE